ncbi:MAG: hypothetical protein GY898_12195 [Proteobacteria bacterium]|nr:hypothetical protein [Pseudomonadota bacterium]
MTRARVLRTLFVRPSDEHALDPVFRFPIAREPRGALPVPLLRLATAALRESKHRVFVHDARMPRTGAESTLRSVAALHKPDVAVVWLHPAALADGLEAARAMRHAGSALVLGAGPLVDLWPEGARRLVELDGLLPSASRGALLAALEVVSTSGRAEALREALAGPARAGGTEPVERKLLDYAVYRRARRGSWPVQPPRPASGLLRFGPPVDKGQGAVSEVPLRDDAGDVLPVDAVLADLASCDLLGIPWQDLGGGSGPSPTQAWWSALLAGLRHMGAKRHLRIALAPADLGRLPLLELAECGVEAVDLGDVDAGDDPVEAAVDAAHACRRAGLDVSCSVVLGSPGYSLPEEQAGVDALRSAGVELTLGVAARPGAGDPVAWTDWADAPSSSFQPPGVDGERMNLARRYRRLHAARAVRVDGAAGLRARLRRVLSSER